MGSLSVTATLQPRGPAAAIVLDESQVASIGEGAKRFPVSATVNGFTWETTVTRMGGEFLLGLNKAIREGAGAEAGDEVVAEIALLTTAREVDVPPALAEALAADPAAQAAFDALTYSTRKEHARSVAEAKRDETRDRRVAKVLSALSG